MTINEIENKLRALFDTKKNTCDNILTFTPHLMDWLLKDEILDFKFDESKLTSKKFETISLLIKMDGNQTFLNKSYTFLFRYDDQKEEDLDMAYKRAMSII